MNACDWLAQLQQTQQPGRWLAQHADALRAVIHRDLRTTARPCALDLLVACAPHALAQPGYPAWMTLLNTALTLLYGTPHSGLQTQLWLWLGEGYMLGAQPTVAASALTNALYRAQAYSDPALTVQALAGLLQLQQLHHQDEPLEDLPTQARALVRQVTTPQQMQLHEALALYHTHRGEVAQAIGRAQVGLALATLTQDAACLARLHLTIAIAYRVADRVVGSVRHLMLLYRAPNLTLLDVGVLHYERGVVLLRARQTSAARHTLQQALSVFEAGPYPHQTAMALHALALADVYQGDDLPAQQRLVGVLMMWQSLGNPYEQANAYHALGYVAARLGLRDEARQWLHSAATLFADQDAPSWAALARRVQRLLARLDARP